MNEQKMYDTLVGLKNAYPILATDRSFNSMVEDLKNNIQTSSVDLPSEKKRVKAIQKYLKRSSNHGTRKILGKAWFETCSDINYQVFTNSYSMFAFLNALPIDTWSAGNETEACPKVSGFIREIVNGDGDCDLVELDYEKLVKAMKTSGVSSADYVVSVLGLTFNANLVKDALDIMGGVDKVLVKPAGKQGMGGKLYLYKDNGDMGMVLGTNINKTFEEWENSHGAKIVEIGKEIR